MGACREVLGPICGGGGGGGGGDIDESARAKVVNMMVNSQAISALCSSGMDNGGWRFVGCSQSGY